VVNDESEGVEDMTRDMRRMFDQWNIGDQYLSTDIGDRVRSDSRDSGIATDEDPLGQRSSVAAGKLPVTSSREVGSSTVVPSPYGTDHIENAAMCEA
jgi:hypothetical protein